MKEKERGSVAVIVLVGLVAILGFGAIVVDGGQVYYQRGKLQSAADAAALAGARVLATQGAHAAQQQALAVALLNGLKPSEVVVAVSLANHEVTVNTTREVNFGLARAINHSTSEVSAAATAGGLALSGVRNVAPLGIVWEQFVYNQQYDLKVGAGGGTSGWYGALSLGGNGASTYRQNMAQGWTGLLRVGDLVPTEAGNMVNPTRQGLQERLNSCNHTPTCTYLSFAPRCPRLMIVPVIAPPVGGQVRVLGFAGFFVDQFVGQGGGDNFIRGRFIEFVAEGEAGPAGYYGALTIKLTK